MRFSRPVPPGLPAPQPGRYLSCRPHGQGPARPGPPSPLPDSPDPGAPPRPGPGRPATRHIKHVAPDGVHGRAVGAHQRNAGPGRGKHGTT
jgi:hypothetical protein